MIEEFKRFWKVFRKTDCCGVLCGICVFIIIGMMYGFNLLITYAGFPCLQPSDISENQCYFGSFFMTLIELSGGFTLFVIAIGCCICYENTAKDLREEYKESSMESIENV